MPDGKSAFELFPKYVFLAAGVIYAAGFLVVLAFLDRFGLREAGADFWKLRYMHIGILCLALPLILNGTILSLFYLILHGKFDRSVMWQRLFPIGLLLINIEIVCFFMVMFTSQGADGRSISGLGPLLWIIGITLVGVPALLVIERIIDHVAGRILAEGDAPPRASEAFAVSGRWILALTVACLDVWFIIDLQSTLANIQPALAIAYVGFSILLGVLVSTASVYEQRQVNEGRKRAVTVLSFSIMGPLLYLVVLAFSYGVYQNIPATRGGGDYTESPHIVVVFKESQTTSTAQTRYFELGSRSVTIPLILIEENSWALYLADPSDGGGPTEWKQIGGRKPNIFIANKSEVTSLASESRNQLKRPL
jgi:hypothetical protein